MLSGESHPKSPTPPFNCTQHKPSHLITEPSTILLSAHSLTGVTLVQWRSQQGSAWGMEWVYRGKAHSWNAVHSVESIIPQNLAFLLRWHILFLTPHHPRRRHLPYYTTYLVFHHPCYCVAYLNAYPMPLFCCDIIQLSIRAHGYLAITWGGGFGNQFMCIRGGE